MLNNIYMCRSNTCCQMHVFQLKQVYMCGRHDELVSSVAKRRSERVPVSTSQKH